MKNTKFLGIAALVAVIVFSLTACETPVDSPKDKTLSGEVTISPSADVTTGTELTASYSGTEPVTLSWQWKKSGGNVGTNANKFTPLEAGSYTVTVKAQGYKSKDSPAVTVTGETLAAVTALTAEYNATTAIFPDTSWQTIKDDLTVKATFSDGTTKTLDAGDYELSGTLAEGESTVTVTYRGKTTTFKVTVGTPHEHVWSDWETVTPATCTKEGLKKHTCSVVTPSHDETEPIAALGHDWGDWKVVKAATCTEEGKKEKVCARDPSHTEEDTIAIDPDAHDWNEQEEEIVAVSETENSVKGITCKRDKSHTKDEEFAGEWATGTAGLLYELISDGENDDTYRVSKGTFNGAELHIPAYHRPDADSEYKLVTEISNGTDASGNSAFGGYTTLTTTVTFAAESELKSIASYAFVYCPALTSITIPDSVTSIGVSAFSNCSALTSITIGAGVTSIGNSAFHACSKLTSVTVAESNTEYSSQDGILYNKAKTEVILVPQTISGAVTIPNSVTSIGSAFAGRSNLTSITIPDSVTEIGKGAFSMCSDLTSVTIGNGVTSIGETAFWRCSSLTSITIGAGLTSIHATAFEECDELASITVAESNANYATQDGILYNKAKTEVILVPQTISGAVTLPNSITSIGEIAFGMCRNLTSITIPNGVTSIGYYAFGYCTSLTSITIPASVTTVSNEAFTGWTDTQTINVPFANAGAKPAGWNNDWNKFCNAQIVYQQ